MKVTHVLIGAGVVLGVIIIAKKFLAPSSSSPQEPAKPSVGGNVDNLVNGARGLFDSFKGLFSGAGPAPAAPPKEAPVPGVNFDIDEDRNGQYATNVIEFRAEA